MSLHFLHKAVATELKARGDILNLGRKQIIAKMQCWDEKVFEYRMQQALF